MTRPTRIPSDVNRPDRVLGPLTARQALILAATAAVLYSAWTGLRTVLALPIFLAVAVPLGAVAVAVALGQRDGLPLDRFLTAALRHRLNPRRIPTRRPPHGWRRYARRHTHGTELVADIGCEHVHGGAGERPGPTGLFADAAVASVGPDPVGPGVLNLGADGLVVIAVVSTLNLGLRTPTEQDALVAGLARYLHTLTGPVQFLIRTVALDVSGHLTALHEQARTLPHPALVAAALGHRAHLAHLAAAGDVDPGFGSGLDSGFGSGFGSGFDDGSALLTRQVLLVLREPAGPGGTQRLLRRLDDATGVLATLDVAVTPLPAAQITALLTDCCHPDCSSRDARPDTSDATPVAIVRRHPQPELDDLQLEELSLAQDRWPETADPWGQGLDDEQPAPLPAPLATDAHVARNPARGMVDFILADDVDDLDGPLEGDLEGGGGEAWWWAR